MAVSADALQVYRGLETLTGVATAQEQARLEHRLVGFVPVAETFSVGSYMPLAHAEIDAALAAGRRPIVVGGTGLYLRAALADLSMRKAEPGEESELWSETTRHPTLLCGLVMERQALYAGIEARVEAILAAGAADEVRAAARRGALAHRPQGARLRGAVARRRRGHEEAKPQLRPAPAHLDAQDGGRAPDRRDRPSAGRRGRRDRGSARGARGGAPLDDSP